MRRSQNFGTDSLASGSVGFSLIETLVALAVLLCGIAVVAQLFAYSVGTNLAAREATEAALMASDKLDALRATSLREVLPSAGSLDPESRVPGYWDLVTRRTGGRLAGDASFDTGPFLRLWEFDGRNPVRITVVVFSLQARLGQERIEVGRASSQVALRF